MKRCSNLLGTATGLLLASAAFTPGLAQEPQPPAATPPPTATTPLLEDTTVAPPVAEPVAPVPPGAQASEPVVNTRASGNEPADPNAAAAPARRQVARQAAPRVVNRAATRPRAPTETPAPRAAPVATPIETSPAPAPAAPPEPVLQTAPSTPTATPPVAIEPVAPTPATEPAPATEINSVTTGLLPWLLAAALAIGALLLLVGRRRRRTADATDPVVHNEPVTTAAEAAPAHDLPVEAVPAAAAAAAVDSGRPWLDLAIRPVRAGVGEDAARVEFELGVENNGSAPAQDVRISTWLMNGNAPRQTEVERMLIERPDTSQRLENSIAAGDGARFETSVDLPRAGLEDAILPVVAAEARYRLPDGGEGRTTASFAVGVARDDELVMFDVDNPSGMHEGVEARLHGEPRRD